MVAKLTPVHRALFDRCVGRVIIIIIHGTEGSRRSGHASLLPYDYERERRESLSLRVAFPPVKISLLPNSYVNLHMFNKYIILSYICMRLYNSS